MKWILYSSRRQPKDVWEAQESIVEAWCNGDLDGLCVEESFTLVITNNDGTPLATIGENANAACQEEG